MLRWRFHQFSGYKKPFVWHITGVSASGRPLYEFVRSIATRRSHTGKFGDFEFAITQPGLYKVGNNKDENGYRVAFVLNKIWRYRSIHDEARAVQVARQLQAGESIEELVQALAAELQWHFSYTSAKYREVRDRDDRRGDGRR
jgi:hypothetical protein